MKTTVSLDFNAKHIEAIDLADVPAAAAAGRYCWIDCDNPVEAAEALAALGVDASATERVAEDNLQGQFHLGRHCIHCTLVETSLVGEELRLNAVHVVLGDGFLATVHSQPSAMLDHVREVFEDDFYTVAQSGGYLLFEIADHLIAGYRETLATMTHSVEDIQKKLLGDVGDEILTDVSELTRSLLDYRNAVVTARETLHELATRRSAYVNESTQPFLDRQTVALERLAGDAATERTVLSETLNLYMGIVSHRTNKVVNRLTIVSIIFLPLNFLAAVYGMNFTNMPELQWHYGYYYFWGITSLLAAGLLLLIRRRRWI